MSTMEGVDDDEDGEVEVDNDGVVVVVMEGERLRKVTSGASVQMILLVSFFIFAVKIQVVEMEYKQRIDRPKGSTENERETYGSYQ